MIIAVMSDSHDNIWNLRKALDVIRAEKSEMLIHCGDFVAPFMIKELAATDIPVHGVFGNNDGDQYRLTKLSVTTFKNITFHDPVGQVDIDGYHIGFTHYEEIAEGLAATGKYNLVCYGHSHTYVVHKTDHTQILNPGEIMGKDGQPGFCLVDTKSNTIKRVAIMGKNKIPP